MSIKTSIYPRAQYISETYSNGLHYVIPMFGDVFMFIIVGFFLVPRMGEFLGKLSIAEAIGSIYGKYSRLLVSIMGVFTCAGTVAAQFKVSNVTTL